MSINVDVTDLAAASWREQREVICEADVFILLLGFRYGAVDPETGLSITEMQYDLAVGHGVPVLAFMLMENAHVPVSSVDIDRHSIEEFRRKILSERVVKFFSSVDQLATVVSLSIVHFIQMSAKPTLRADTPSLIRNVRVIRLLLSSPGDVTAEREACSRVVFRFNQQQVEDRGLFIKLVRWEDMAPQIGPGAQNVVNMQIGEYDLFSGIMWNRFGTPTDVAASGTEEEFRAALARWRETGHPWITFYFCDRPVTFSNEQQLEQKAKVLRFRAEMLALGLVRVFESVDEFENKLLQDLLRITASGHFRPSPDAG